MEQQATTPVEAVTTQSVREGVQKGESRTTFEEEDDVVKQYVETLYRTAQESTWRSFVLDKSQSIAFSTTLSSVVLFLWFVSLFGMQKWSVGSTRVIGLTTFCASFSFTLVSTCHILPAQSLVCPPNFESPTCISWFDISFPDETTDFVILQVLGLVGTAITMGCTVLSFYTLMRLTDQTKFRRAMQSGAVLMFLNSLVSLADFVLYLNTKYYQEISDGKGCVLLPSSNGTIHCEPTKNIDPPLGEGYAYTATVVVFTFSVINSLFFAMGSMKGHYDLEKSD